MISFSLFLSSLITFLITLITSKYLLRRKKRLSPINKCILITGCDSGIGFEAAKRLHSIGFTVIATCLNLDSDGAKKLHGLQDRNDDNESENESENDSDPKLYVIELDVTDKGSIHECRIDVEEILNQNGFEGLWGIINNAGVCVFGEFDWLTPSQIERTININVIGTILVTKTFLPLIKKTKCEDANSSVCNQGRIIIVGSINGFCSYPGLSIYCASKFALEGFSQVLRAEVKKLALQVILIRPGDFAKLTNIMASHRKSADEMWNAMSASDKKLYQKYFHAYHDHIVENAGMTSPSSFEKSTLFHDLEESLLSVAPRIEITVAPLGFRIFFNILSLIPSGVKDWFIHALYVHVFKFDAKKYLQENNQESESTQL